MRTFLNAVAVAGMLLLGGTSQAAVVRTIDLRPIDGTTVNSLTAPGGAVVDFGALGKGRIEFQSLTPGAGFAFRIPFAGLTPQTVTLDNGNQFISTDQFIFDLTGNNASFIITVTLDAGNLPAGSLFEILSLDRDATGAQYFLPGAGMGAVYSNQLPSDGTINLVADPLTGLYSAAGSGISKGRVWDVAGVNSFSGTFSQDKRFGGVAFTIATGQIPEPGSLALVVMSMGALALAGNGRRQRRLAAA